jgi:hypothetical protein
MNILEQHKKNLQMIEEIEKCNNPISLLNKKPQIIQLLKSLQIQITTLQLNYERTGGK